MKFMFTGFSGGACSYALSHADSDEKLKRASSVTIFNIDQQDVEKSMEYFFASDARYFFNCSCIMYLYVCKHYNNWGESKQASHLFSVFQLSYLSVNVCI